MGKKVRKKNRAPVKEKPVATHAPKVGHNETLDDGALVAIEGKPCLHLDKGVDLSKLSAKIGASETVGCQDCREGAADRRGGQGKGKHWKKKGSTLVDSKSESKAIWICLECGHYACGGIGFPSVPRSHTVLHARLTHHPLVVQLANPNLRWCFQCDAPIPVQKSEDNGEHKDILMDVVKLIKGRASEGSSVDVEDVWFGGGSVTSDMRSKTNALNVVDGKSDYMVRGLINLGNTCFFNSIMQNLLTMTRLQDHFFKLDPSYGPLNTSLKKLFAETKLEAGSKHALNPRSFFGCLCSKAPQFRGYQQHDSHELLRCLLDGLCAEELAVKTQVKSSQVNGNSSDQFPTFVDTVFGGKISSTVCCLECGYSSTVYEPFLDLSLPVPNKKPPSKKTQPVSGAKKTKLPPKRGGRFRPRVNKDAECGSVQSVSVPSASSESSSLSSINPKTVASLVDSTKFSNIGPHAEETAAVSQNCSVVQESKNEKAFENTIDQTTALSDGFSWLDYLEPGTLSDEYDFSSQNVLAIQHSGNIGNTTEQTVTLSDNFTWLDYVGPETMSDEHDLTSQGNDDVLISQDSGNKDVFMNEGAIQSSSQISSEVCSSNRELNLKPDFSLVNLCEDELPLQVQDSEVLLLPYKEETSGTWVTATGEAEASAMSCGQEEETDFDGFGGLFNEPEIPAGPVTKPSVGDNISEENGFIGVSCSESDPDEVDNLDSQVSVESCLAHFVKPECLSNENAWYCENCSKILQRKRLEVKKKQAKVTSNICRGGSEGTSQTDSLSLDKDSSSHSTVKNFSNGNIASNNMPNCFSQSSVSCDGTADSSENCIKAETDEIGRLNPGLSRGLGVIEDVLPKILDSSSCHANYHQESVTGRANDSCPVAECSSTGCNTAADVQQSDYHSLNGECEVDEVGDGEMDSNSIKVKRDATKRVLIYKAPPILTIHLKRFSQDARGRLSKLNGHVNFGEKIDLRSYLDPRCLDRENCVYHLVGVVEHSGTMKGGHYVAYVRGCQKSKGKTEKENVGYSWYHVSDAHVREVLLEEVLRSEAYILFYENVQV